MTLKGKLGGHEVHACSHNQIEGRRVQLGQHGPVANPTQPKLNPTQPNPLTTPHGAYFTTTAQGQGKSVI